MWFIFPQLAGLGSSLMSQRFAIKSIDEARRYLADPVLGGRLRRHIQLVLKHTNKPILDIFGSPDDLKFHSCLTLFSEAATEQSDRDLFTRVRTERGRRCDPFIIYTCPSSEAQVQFRPVHGP